jgi:hypothetical protein
MAWGFIAELPLSREEYDRLNAEISPDPDGLILHTASEKGGTMRVIDVWESKDAYQRFERDILFPALERIGGDTPDEPPPLDEFGVHNMRGRAG